MDNEKLKAKVLGIIPEAEVIEGKQFLEVTVNPGKLLQLARQLKEDPDLNFDYLYCQTGIDYTDSLAVVYHLESTVWKHFIVLKVKIVNRENPIIESVYSLWKAAEYHEREIFDLLGIQFRNHPDLRRFFLDDSWGYPLRKDFKDEVNVIEK